jgi:sn-glycerol 3-phosphate transport system permease protein
MKPDGMKFDSPHRASGIFGLVGTHGLMIALSLFAVFPILWMIVSSLKAENEILSPSFWPVAPTLANYEFALKRLPLLRLLGNTTVVALTTAVAQALTSLLAAYALVRWTRPGWRLLHTLIALSWLVPFQITMVPNYVLAAQLGWLNSIAGLVVPHLAAAFGVLLIYNSMKSFPRETIEAAQIDGAGDFRILTQIVTPNLAAPLVSFAILAFIHAWNEYFWPLLLTRKIENSVVQIGLQMFMTQEGNLWGPLMAAATLASLPILVLYLSMQRLVVEAFVSSYRRGGRA